MTRNEKIALGIGAGVVVFGGLALYFSATSKPSSAAPQTPPTPSTTPPLSPASSFAPTITPTPESHAPTMPLTPASQFPPSWNQFTSVVAGHTYLITLTSSTPVDWASIVKPSAVPGGFNGPFGHASPTPTQYTYSLTATVTHQVQNVMFLLGVLKPVTITVTDLGVI